MCVCPEDVKHQNSAAASSFFVTLPACVSEWCISQTLSHYLCVYYHKAQRVANGGGGGGVCVCVLSVCTMRVCLRVVARVHLSLLPRPQRLALHLSSINHRERLLSPSVAIVSGPETVLGCLAAWREEK